MGVNSNEIKPYVKSAKIPSDEENVGPLKTVVALNLQEFVSDPTKDVMIVCHNPEEKQEEKFEIFEELASHYSKISPEIVFAKLDVIDNDIGVNIDKFPFLIFYPAKKELE